MLTRLSAHLKFRISNLKLLPRRSRLSRVTGHGSRVSANSIATDSKRRPACEFRFAGLSIPRTLESRCDDRLMSRFSPITSYYSPLTEFLIATRTD
jgi:hypothetical protein